MCFSGKLEDSKQAAGLKLLPYYNFEIFRIIEDTHAYFSDLLYTTLCVEDFIFIFIESGGFKFRISFNVGKKVPVGVEEIKICGI